MTREEILAYIQANPYQTPMAGTLEYQNALMRGDLNPDSGTFTTTRRDYNIPGVGRVWHDPMTGSIDQNDSPYGLANYGQNTIKEWNTAGSDGIDRTFDYEKGLQAKLVPIGIGLGGLAMAAGAGGLLGGESVFGAGSGMSTSGTSIGSAGGSIGMVNPATLAGAADGLASTVALPSVGSLGATAAGTAGTMAGVASEAIPQMVITGSAPSGLTGSTLAAGAAGIAANSIPFENDFLASNVIQDAAANNTLSVPNGSFSEVLKSIVDSPITKAIAPLVGGLAGAVSSADTPKSTTATTQSQLDPRMAEILYGADGKGGLLNRLSGFADDPRSTGLTAGSNAADAYYGANNASDLSSMRTAASGLMNSAISAPSMTAASMTAPTNMAAAKASAPANMLAAQSQAATINAPNQNKLDLSNAYNSMVYGNSAENPYLTGAIQKGINQSNTAFGNMLQDQTKATQGLLGNIRGGAIAAGQYGGSRQGIAEGQALDSFNTNMSRALSQFGQNNTDAAVGAQAGAYDAGQNRALSAMSGLGAQQYGVATNQAGFNQQTNLANQQAQQQAALTNYQGALQTNLANAGFTQGANQTNYSGNLATNQANAGFTQGANTNNLQSNLSTNSLNSANQQAGINATSGLLGNAYNQANAGDMYDLNKTGTVAGLLSPFTGLNQTNTQTNPLYSNTAGNVLGGALTASSIYKNLFGAG